MHASIRRRVMVECLAFAFVAGAGRAHAEPTHDDKALATILFQEGRSLMTAGKISEACLKFEESDRLDPGGGTILNLARCHELEGRLARGWSEFNEAAIRARRDGRRDREVEASERARALEPRLSKLTVVVPAGSQVEGLQIERDGREIGPGAWATAMPVDGGEYVVRATAPGKEPFTARVTIAPERDSQSIEIPVLATPVVVVTPPSFSPEGANTAAAVPSTSPSAGTLRWVGIGMAGAGVVTLGVAGYVLSTALSKKADSKSDCVGDVCGDTGLALRQEAVARGNTATILGITGAVLLGAGVTLFFLDGRSPADGQSARPPTRLTLVATPQSCTAAIHGAF